jgi:hypothetical protein
MKIKEFIDKVGTDVSGKWVYIDNVELLSELIVNECADWVKSRTLSNELKEGLKRHFGIKE